MHFVFFIFLFSKILIAGERYAAFGNFEWKTGQIIGMSEMISDPSTFIFEVATGSRYGHVGIVEKEADGSVFVFEADPPSVQKTSLDQFLSRATHDTDGEPEITVEEVSDELSVSESSALTLKMKEWADKKIPYNFSLSMNDASVNCSEFVYKIFGAVGISGIGEIAPLRESDMNAFGGFFLKFLGRTVPKNAPGVSPMSVMSSRKTKVVLAKLPVGRIMSEAEVFEAWEKGGGLPGFAKLVGQPMNEIKNLKERASQVPYRNYPANWR